MATSLRANIDVDDLEKGLAFYRDAFGMRVSRRLGDGWAELSGGSFVIDLLVKAPGSLPFSGASSGRDYQRHWTPVHLDFCVEDLEATVARALQAGARQEGEILERPFGRMALLRDPFGHGLCVLQLVEGDYDRLPGVVRS